MHRPRNNYVLVKPASDKLDTTEGGVALPDSLVEFPPQGTIVAVGPGVVDRKGRKSVPRVKEGDRVIFQRGGGFEVKDGQDILLLVGVQDILAII